MSEQTTGSLGPKGQTSVDSGDVSHASPVRELSSSPGNARRSSSSPSPAEITDEKVRSSIDEDSTDHMDSEYFFVRDKNISTLSEDVRASVEKSKLKNEPEEKIQSDAENILSKCSTEVTDAVDCWTNA